MRTVPKIEFLYSWKRNCAASVPIPTFMCLCAVFYIPRIGPHTVFGCSKLILEIYTKSITDIWVWELEDRTLQFCFGNKEAAQFHFWEYINGNQTFILDFHRPFICTVSAGNATQCSAFPVTASGRLRIIPTMVAPPPWVRHHLRTQCIKRKSHTEQESIWLEAAPASKIIH